MTDVQSPELVMEMCLISACMQSGRAIEDVRGSITPQHFQRAAHRVIFGGLLDMADQGITNEPEALRARISAANAIDKCGGDLYLIDLYGYLPTGVNARYYAEQVLANWFKRELTAITANPPEEDEGGTELRSRVEALCSAAALGQSMMPTLRLGTIGTGKRRHGVLTNIRQLDTMTTHGGLVRGQQSTVAAYHKQGKTAWMVTLALAIAEQGLRVGYCTFADLDGEGLEERAMKQLTGWSFEPTGTDAPEYNEAKHRLATGMRIDVYDPLRQRGGRDIESCIAWLRRESDVEPFSAVFFDYGQKLRSRKKSLNHLEQADECSQQVDDAAREMNFAAVVGSQVTLGRDGGVEQTKGSRIWEENTALLMRLIRFEEKDLPKLDEQYRHIAGISAIDVKLNRFGPSGRLWAIWDQGRVRYDVFD